MIQEGISYPLKGDSALTRIIVGTLLTVGSFLLIPAFVLLGYLVNVLEQSARGGSDPPAFDDWAGMLVDGLKATLVTMVYGIIPFGIMSVFISSIAAGGITEGGAGSILAGVGLIGILLSFVALVVVYYLVPAALTNMAIEDSLGAAFDFQGLKDVLLSSEYLIAWLVPFGISFVLNIVVFLLSVTVIGLVLVPSLQFYAQVAIFFMFGRAFGNIKGLSSADRETAGAAV
jgi:hypothetical protein